MGGTRQRRATHAARAVLLILLALGVCGMHTLGHIDGRHHASLANGHGPTMPLPAADPSHPSIGSDPGVLGLDPTDVCLAVLSVFMVVMGLAAWLRTRRRTHLRAGSLSPARQVARPPPKPTSLRLASLSVLRI
ncbi:hypothetical protein [Nonomuraea rubra]|uniref:hypothetical protein n=1 Tax=Nonomuraea rubra TaxID=46180 RepID=UPI0033F0579A